MFLFFYKFMISCRYGKFCYWQTLSLYTSADKREMYDIGHQDFIVEMSPLEKDTCVRVFAECTIHNFSRLFLCRVISQSWNCASENELVL